MGNSTVAIAVFLANVAPSPAAAVVTCHLQNLRGAENPYFDKLICKNVGSTRPTVIMSEAISKYMVVALAAINALPDTDQFRPGNIK